ncbi:ATP-binding protein [Cytobacillus purgationiresistens]|uniref:histidine kinase n=1 Tax=Cytobacillus purgationiresistens TaxID=863449 RepID=A0ABU0ACL5_9BACI|nr:ATP-binding protein [Cytobacillus purgationiresistens]MDQ0268989.1 signal transduction histidine kinase [Cytobacillus purgationiresistens]
MKVKFFYKLLTSHILILFLAFLLLSVLFSHFVESYIFENRVEELSEYGEQILIDITVRLDETQELLIKYSQLLEARNIQYILFDGKGNIIYPNIRDPIVKLSNAEWNQLSSGKQISVSHDIKRFDQEVTLVAMPYMQGDRISGGILLLSPTSSSMQMVGQLNKYLIYTIGISLSAAIFLSLFFSKNLSNRIKVFRNATSMISEGNYNVNVPDESNDELGNLAKDFNKMANKLKVSNEEIDRLENRRQKFLADVSHELRTPLTTISGLAEGIKNELIPEQEVEKGMTLIDREAKRLIRLVNENLDYEKIRSNQLHLNIMEIHVIEVFEVVSEQLLFQAEEKNNQISIEADDQLTLMADYDRIVQILVNIVKNSIQFTENGWISLRAVESEECIQIDIEDNGIGIDPKEVDWIWERFYKADTSRTNNYFGEFGIGLSIVKQLVELHDGKIEVVSEQGKGTMFSLLFPKK